MACWVIHDRVRAVVLVEGLEHDHFVSRIDDRQHRRDHRLRRAAAHGHVQVGFHGHAVARREIRGNRFPQHFGAPGDGVLVHIGRDRVDRSGFQRVRSRKVGKSLRQIHRTVPMGEARHLPDDRLGEPGDLLRRSRPHRHFVWARCFVAGFFAAGDFLLADDALGATLLDFVDAGRTAVCSTAAGERFEYRSR